MKTRNPATIEVTPHVAAMIRGDIECVASTLDEVLNKGDLDDLVERAEHVLALARGLREYEAQNPPEDDDVPAGPGPTIREVNHNATFSIVKWFGTTYYFAGAQQSVVAQLWAAWRKGKPGVRAGDLLAEAEYKKPLHDLFKNHPAWLTMIVKADRDGEFRLNPPDGVRPPKK